MLSLLSGSTIYAMEHYTKQWTVATVFGSFAQSKFRYYIEPQLRLIDDKYVFNQSLFLVGLGYQVTPDMMIFTGPGWITIKDPNGKMFHEFRIWQQINWNVIHTTKLNLNLRTRMEETSRTNEPQISLVFRQRAWLRIPFSHWENHTLSMYDEVFFNFNHARWSSPYFFSQNRAFIGIGTKFSKSQLMDIGYLNQYVLSRKYQLSNILLVSFTFFC